MACLHRHRVKAAHHVRRGQDHDRYQAGYYCQRKWKVVTEADCAKCTGPLEEEGTHDLSEHPRAVPSSDPPLEGEMVLKLRRLKPARKIG